MIRLLVPVIAVVLLSACAGTAGMQMSMPCMHCEKHCQCAQNCRCENCERCPHCANAENAKGAKPCKICMENDRDSAFQVNR